jgi:hypothetical protein
MPLKEAAAKYSPYSICKPPVPQAGRRGDLLFPIVSGKRVSSRLARDISA